MKKFEIAYRVLEASTIIVDPSPAVIRVDYSD
jgi:hypothetical protein